jgi:chromosome segregation ATPase
MTNENNKFNELVADDDDPTVELEAVHFVQDQTDAPESDAKTYDSEQADAEEPTPGITVSELQSDLRSRKKAISHLQYDIQQLHTKWLGLETEIGTREAQAEQLNSELSSSREAVNRKERLLKKRDQKIKALKTEIRQREDNYRQISVRVEEMQLLATESAQHFSDSEHPAEEPPQSDLQRRLSRTEEYADSLRQQSQDLIESNSRAERKIESLSQRLDEALQKNSQLSDGLTLSEGTHEKLQAIGEL